jgi:hypothetical protein
MGRYNRNRGYLVAPRTLDGLDQISGVRNQNAVYGSGGGRRSEDSLGTAVTGGLTGQARQPPDDDAPPPYEPKIERRQTR